MKTLNLKSTSKLLIFLSLLSFLSCSTGAKQNQASVSSSSPKKYQDIVSQTPKTSFENMLESTKGKDIEYMTDRFGFPEKSIKHPNENRVFEYDLSKKKDKDGEKLITGLLDMVSPSVGTPLFFSILSSMSTVQCAFWLEVNDDDVIRKWKWEGKDCERIYQRIREIPKSKICGAWLGLEVQALTPEIKKRLNIDQRVLGGVFVNSVISNSPAHKSGIMQGDVITEINRNNIYSPQDLVDIVSKSRAGDKVLILVFRNGRSLYVSAVLEEVRNPAH